MATDAERPMPGMRCAACEGAIEVMGCVTLRDTSRLVQIMRLSPCDDRCTHATGPSCDCSCGGKNHGTQVTVTVIRDVGGVPKVTPPNPEKARRVHGEWMAAKRATEQRIDRHYPERALWARGDYLTAWASSRAEKAKRLVDAIAAAANLKTHAGRLKALQAINEKLTESAR